MHFRDIKDILAQRDDAVVLSRRRSSTTGAAAPERIRPFLDLNPFTHLAIYVSGDPVFSNPGGRFGHWKWLLALGVGSTLLFLFAYFLFDRLRDSFAEEV